MRYEIIASGSKGNCLLIPDVPVMIDLGVPYKALRGCAGAFQSAAPAVFLTHKHGDHFNQIAVRSLLLDHPATLFIVPKKMVQSVADAMGEKVMQNVLIADFDRKYVIANGRYNISYLCQETYHDAPNVCWHIYVTDKETGKTERMFYATDTGHLEGIKARNYDYYFIEGNHTVSEIEKRMWDKLEAGEYSYEIRAAKNHLSVEQALDFIAENAGPNSKYILMHEHVEKEPEKSFSPIDK